MENFSAKRLLLNVLLLLMAVFMIVAGINRLTSFLKVNSVKVVNEKLAIYPVYKQMEGNAFFMAVPVVASANGNIEKLVGDFNYVEKDELIGRIKSADFSVDILSPSEGLLLWGRFKSYLSSLNDIKRLNFAEDDFSVTGETAKKGDVICSVVNNDVFYIALPSEKKELFLYEGGFTIRGTLKWSGKNFSLYSFNQYMKYFIDKKNYLVLEGFKKGVKVKSDMIVEKGGEDGIYIVRGNIIKFVPIVSYPLGNEYRLAVGQFKASSIIVVATPRLVRNGEIFNE